MGDTAGALLPLLLLGLAFVVLIVLPMRSRNRALQQTRQMQAGLSPGVEVMMTSGLLGRVTTVGDDTVELEIAPGVVVRWAKAAVAEIRTAGPAAPDEPPSAEPSRTDGEAGTA